MCFVAGTFGVVPLCAHTIAYNIIPLSAMVPLGLGIGLTNRIGHVLSSLSSNHSGVRRAQQIAAGTVLLAAAMGAGVGVALYVNEKHIVGLFTTDENVAAQTHAIWDKVCFYIFLYYLYFINGSILRGKYAVYVHSSTHLFRHR